MPDNRLGESNQGINDSVTEAAKIQIVPRGLSFRFQ